MQNLIKLESYGITGPACLTYIEYLVLMGTNSEISTWLIAEMNEWLPNYLVQV